MLLESWEYLHISRISFSSFESLLLIFDENLTYIILCFPYISDIELKLFLRYILYVLFKCRVINNER